MLRFYSATNNQYVQCCSKDTNTILSRRYTNEWENRGLNVILQTKVQALQSCFSTMIMINWIIFLLHHNVHEESVFVSCPCFLSTLPDALPHSFSVLLLSLSLPTVDQTLQLSCSRWLCSATRTPTMHRAPMWEASTGNNMISTYTYTSISPALLYISTVHLHIHPYIIRKTLTPHWTEHLVKVVGNNLLELCCEYKHRQSVSQNSFTSYCCRDRTEDKKSYFE